VKSVGPLPIADTFDSCSGIPITLFILAAGTP